MEALIVLSIVAVILFLIWKKKPSINTFGESVKKICKHCAMEIPQAANICPHCRKRLTTSLIAKIATGFIGLMVLFAIIGNISSPSKTVTEPAHDQTPQKKKTDENLTRAIAGAIIMKKLAPDPDSLKINMAYITSKGDACYEFKFHNAIGGISIQKAVMPVNGDSLLIPLSDGFIKNWNNRCAGKSGEDVADYLEIALK